jgi:hypothetical protein
MSLHSQNVKNFYLNSNDLALEEEIMSVIDKLIDELELDRILEEGQNEQIKRTVQ